MGTEANFQIAHAQKITRVPILIVICRLSVHQEAKGNIQNVVRMVRRALILIVRANVQRELRESFQTVVQQVPVECILAVVQLDP